MRRSTPVEGAAERSVGRPAPAGRGEYARRPRPLLSWGAMIDPSARVHPTADIEADVTVGPRTSIWNRAQVRRGAPIGAECVVGRDAFIDEDVVIGDRVKIQNAALVYHGVTVEDGVFIGPNAILTNDRFPRAITADGRPRPCRRLGREPDPPATGASIGAGAVVVAGNDVGRFATVGAGRGRDARRARPCARRRQPRPPHRLGVRVRPAPAPTRRARRSPPTASGAAACAAAASRYEIDDATLRRPRRARPHVIPISKPDIGPAEEQAVLDVLRSGMLAMGSGRPSSRQAWASYCGVRHAVLHDQRHRRPRGGAAGARTSGRATRSSPSASRSTRR